MSNEFDGSFDPGDRSDFIARAAGQRCQRDVYDYMDDFPR